MKPQLKHLSVISVFENKILLMLFFSEHKRKRNTFPDTELSIFLTKATRASKWTFQKSGEACIRILKINNKLKGQLKNLNPSSACSKKSGLFNHTTFRPF